MKESLTGRVGRLISGGFHALVDAVENAVPEAVMEQAIREIDSAIDDVRVELGRVVASRHLANTRLTEENSRHESLAVNIELAVKENRDDLAEAAIAQQLDIEAQVPVLEAAIAEANGREKELEGFISALQAKKREMQEELKLYRETMAGVVGEQGAVMHGCNNESVDAKVARAESAFERVLERATGFNSNRPGFAGKTSAKVAELEALAHRNRIQERLAAIKTEMG
ncbi:MAG: PspA/IM30 family protein [Gammaproteobacteria bacterium]|nr:PspA/IM30 family protein [Gammaproteobacteria bacterium]MDH5651983.1 PspA/IM30 family protein [Gammaproteobacteria bacterium]